VPFEASPCLCPECKKNNESEEGEEQEKKNGEKQDEGHVEEKDEEDEEGEENRDGDEQSEGKKRLGKTSQKVVNVLTVLLALNTSVAEIANIIFDALREAPRGSRLKRAPRVGNTHQVAGLVSIHLFDDMC
jgi:hypothetical protein